MRNMGRFGLLALMPMLIVMWGCEKSPRDGAAPPLPPREAIDQAPAAEAPADAQASESTGLTVPNRGVLAIPLPADMTARAAGSDVPGAVALRLEGSDPEPYVITLTVLGEPGMMPGFGSDAWLAEELEHWNQALPDPAMAAEAVPVEFELGNARGMYLNLEDSAPQPGEYPYLLKGFFNVDGCIVSFQVLHHVPRASAANRFLALLVDADWEPETGTL